MNRNQTERSRRDPRIDEFLSNEDLDLQNLSQEELVAWWNAWLEAAQISNGEDQFDYSHGVFRRYVPGKRKADGNGRRGTRRRGDGERRKEGAATDRTMPERPGFHKRKDRALIPEKAVDG